MVTYKKATKVGTRVYYMEKKIDFVSPVSNAMKSLLQIAIILFN